MAGKRKTPEFRDSRELMLDAAQRLFAQEGFAATSLRDVTKGAGVNLAAVNYYFGSKAALIRAVIQRILIQLNLERRLNLVSLTAPEQTPSVEELLSAYLSPLFDLLTVGSPPMESPSSKETALEHEQILVRLYARIVTDPGDEVRTVVAQESAVVDADYLQSFGRALPQLPSEELAWRFRCITGVVLASFSSKMLPTHTESMETYVKEWMIAYLAAALRAPP
ncbi:MAG TPA: TetR family transcriptional regulator [Ktedonosporobacter sp.]|nr:TetR family transcriptional regulator [Ktedonosporobacter sp.]